MTSPHQLLYERALRLAHDHLAWDARGQPIMRVYAHETPLQGMQILAQGLFEGDLAQRIEGPLGKNAPRDNGQLGINDIIAWVRPDAVAFLSLLRDQDTYRALSYQVDPSESARVSLEFLREVHCTALARELDPDRAKILAHRLEDIVPRYR